MPIVLFGETVNAKDKKISEQLVKTMQFGQKIRNL